MRVTLGLTLVGAALGAVIAVVVHFMSYTVPSTYYVSAVSFEGSNRVDQTLESPLVHPSWLPVLPVAVAIGAVVGILAAVLFRSLGLQLTRRRDVTDVAAAG